MNQDGKPKRRRWLQFSLRSLFVVMTIVAVWLGLVMHKARRLRRSVDAITAAGGAVYFHHQIEGNSADAPPPGPAWLRRFVGDEPFLTPVHVYLGGPRVTDALIADNLGSMTSVEDLHIESANVTDAALVHIRSMPHLHWLILDCPRLTDAAPARLASLPELYGLSLNCARLTDAALSHIATHPKLGSLTLNSPNLTAPGLRQLDRLKYLEFVRSCRDLDNQKVMRLLRGVPAKVELDHVPLVDVLEEMVDFHREDLPVDLDDVPETKRLTPITLTAKGSLGSVLDAILESCELGYYFDNGKVRIAPREIALERRRAFYTLRSILPSDGKIETDW